MPRVPRIKSLNQRLANLAYKLADRAHEPARRNAQTLDQLLEAPREIFARLCPELCPSCGEACCRRVSYRGVMDSTDLIFLAVQGVTSLPQAEREGSLCPWLGLEGCALPWKARPFACLHYLCEPLQQSMSLNELKQVRACLAQAGDARSRLLGRFMEP